MMRVYCLFGVEDWHDCETHTLLGIYSSEELAKKYLEIERDKDHYSDYFLSENKVTDQ